MGINIRFFTSRLYVLAELCVITLIMPLALLTILPLRIIIPLLWLTVLYAYQLQRRLDPTLSRRNWRWRAEYGRYLLPMGIRFLVSTVLVVILTFTVFPEKFGSLVRERPLLWALVMVLYPLLSVVPQEYLFRRFFFWRYAVFFPAGLGMVLASGLSFGFVHIIFENWVAPVLSAVGGIIFAKTYQRTGSLRLAILEHAAYGCMVFTVGLGQFFYHGAALHH